MTYIPNVRCEMDELSANYGKERVNPYYEGNLHDDDKMLLKAYDWAVNQADGWFYNVGCFNGVSLDEDYVDALKEDLLAWMEACRNEMVVSIIDGYEEEPDGD